MIYPVKARLTILGTGNLFTPLIPSAAYLIEPGYRVNSDDEFKLRTDQDSFLFDCGFNTFPQLISTLDEKRMKNISSIIISHNHFDHIGSLGQFIYYRYFKYKKITRIYTAESNIEALSKILENSISKVPGFDSTTQSPNPRDLRIVPYKLLNKSPYFRFFNVDHCNMPACGIYFKKFNLTITGDTDILLPEFMEFSRIIIHDCSLTPAPGVHAFIKNIASHYSDEIKEKILLTHHGLTEPLDNSEYNHLNFAFPNQVYYL